MAMMATPTRSAIPTAKRSRPDDATLKENDLDDARSSRPPPKRRRVAPARAVRDLLSPLSDELLVRILSFLPLQHLLAVAPVSRRFYNLAADSQLWKALYYARFVLPRAMRIPGFREGPSGSGAGHKLHYSGRRTLWADGRRGGLVRKEDVMPRRGEDVGQVRPEGAEDDLPGAQKGEELAPKTEGVNWKRQYKIRYNWSKGKCAVEELRIGGGELEDSDEQQERKILAKVIEGIAITADESSGLRAWDLKSRQLLAQIDLAAARGEEAAPSCIAIDDGRFDQGVLDVAVGFLDGSFGVWRLNTVEKHLLLRYRHEKSSNGELIAMAFSYPYLLTATGSVLVSLYTFEVPSRVETDREAGDEDQEPKNATGIAVTEAEEGFSSHTVTGFSSEGGDSVRREETKGSRSPVAGMDALAAPYLLTSLNSHTSRPPLALSIRRVAATTIASIAYTFSTRRGWSIGIQDLHIRFSRANSKSTPEVTTTRIAYTAAVDDGGTTYSPPASPATPRRQNGRLILGSGSPPGDSPPPASVEPGPTTLCYTHPYLLATLPDNTLLLHMCTSNTSSLSISRGIRLWGHTSGISDAEITARGKAVSVSSRGEEMRVWELEGRLSGMGSRSVAIRPEQSAARGWSLVDGSETAYDWDARRNWVGFDDEMVIVLKEIPGGGRKSLMVYDFT